MEPNQAKTSPRKQFIIGATSSNESSSSTSADSSDMEDSFVTVRMPSRRQSPLMRNSTGMSPFFGGSTVVSTSPRSLLNKAAICMTLNRSKSDCWRSYGPNKQPKQSDSDSSNTIQVKSEIRRKQFQLSKLQSVRLSGLLSEISFDASTNDSAHDNGVGSKVRAVSVDDDDDDDDNEDDGDDDDDNDYVDDDDDDRASDTCERKLLIDRPIGKSAQTTELGYNKDCANAAARDACCAAPCARSGSRPAPAPQSEGLFASADETDAHLSAPPPPILIEQVDSTGAESSPIELSAATVSPSFAKQYLDVPTKTLRTPEASRVCACDASDTSDASSSCDLSCASAHLQDERISHCLSADERVQSDGCCLLQRAKIETCKKANAATTVFKSTGSLSDGCYNQQVRSGTVSDDGFASGCGGSGGVMRPTLSGHYSSREPFNWSPSSRRSGQVDVRLRSWKRAHKLITLVHENPFSAHMDLIERLARCETATTNKDKQSRVECKVEESGDTRTGEMEESSEKSLVDKNPLENYATKLSDLYGKYNLAMDANTEFRGLLYDIICCLLVQDETTLATPSVNKLLDVIRAHIESVTSAHRGGPSGCASGRQVKGEPKAAATPCDASSGSSGKQHNYRKSSLISFTSCSSSGGSGSGSGSGNEFAANQRTTFCTVSDDEDEQLISSLSQKTLHISASSPALRQLSLSPTAELAPHKRRVESAWAYAELATERRRNEDQRPTSQVSSLSVDADASKELSQHAATNCSGASDTDDLATVYDDSGHGTAPESHRSRARVSSLSSSSSTPSSSSSSSSASSSSSSIPTTTSGATADALNVESRHLATQSASARLPLIGARNRSTAQAGATEHRAELEWTLNKLINIELKHNWLTSKDTLRRAIRRIGIPNEIRARVWSILVEQTIGDKHYDTRALLEKARDTINEQQVPQTASNNDDDDDEIGPILKQIELDVNRTMPGHRLFDEGAEGGRKLRRVLVAYSVHVNREIAYCQGFNFIVALLLSVFEGDEDKALRGFIAIVEHTFPSKHYFDHYLTGARADQFLLNDFICDQLLKCPNQAQRKTIEGITSSITLNWFISLFHGALPTMTRLTILDHFMLDGVKALFKFTMAILYLAFKITPPLSCDVYATIRDTAKNMFDIKLLLSIVDQIKLPKDCYFAIRRSFYMVQSSFNSDHYYMSALSHNSRPSSAATQRAPSAATKNGLSLSLIGANAARLHGLGLRPGPHLATGASATLPPDLGSFATSQRDRKLAAAANGTTRTPTLHNQPTSPSLYNELVSGPRVCTSQNRTKICVQKLAKLGRSHLHLLDTQSKLNERSLVAPLRNCLVVGVSNCGKNVIIVRRASRKSFKLYQEQDLLFHVHELNVDIFDGFYIEDSKLMFVVTHKAELLKLDLSAVVCLTPNTSQQKRQQIISECYNVETLLLRDLCSSSKPSVGVPTANVAVSAHSHSTGGLNTLYNNPQTTAARPRPAAHDAAKIKVRIASIDPVTNLMWIYLECEETLESSHTCARLSSSARRIDASGGDSSTVDPSTVDTAEHASDTCCDVSQRRRLSFATASALMRFKRGYNPFGNYNENAASETAQATDRLKSAKLPERNVRRSRRIIMIDLITFDVFSAFVLQPNFGDIIQLKASLVAFCQLSNPMSNQFSSRIVQISPLGRFEQMLSFSDVVDYIVKVSDAFIGRAAGKSDAGEATPRNKSKWCYSGSDSKYLYSSLRRFLITAQSSLLSHHGSFQTKLGNTSNNNNNTGSSTLTKYYRSLTRSQSVEPPISGSPKPTGSAANDNNSDAVSTHSTKSAKTSGGVRNRCDMSKIIKNNNLRSMITTCSGNFGDLTESSYIPVNMVFIFKNGKIALFEFKESYVIHTRESQLDRYDYAKVIDVHKNEDDFIVTILTIFDKVIKVVI